MWLVATGKLGNAHCEPTATAVVAIQDGKALDFSSGKPVFKTDPALAGQIAELDSVAGTVMFAPKQGATAHETRR